MSVTEVKNKKMSKAIKILKECLNRGECTNCQYGKCGKPMLCCKELIKDILDELEESEKK